MKMTPRNEEFASVLDSQRRARFHQMLSTYSLTWISHWVSGDASSVRSLS